MTWRRALPFGAAAAVAALACNLGSSATPDAGASASPVEVFCNRAMGALAEKQVICQGLPAKASKTLFLRSTNSGLCQNLAKAAAANRVKHDAAKEQGCLSAIPAASCSTVGAGLAAIAACAQAVSGQVAANGTCYTDIECAGDARCASSDGADACAKTCKPLAGLGGACSSSSDCNAGAKCPDGSCVAPKTSGACTVDDECADGHPCTGDPGACTALKKLGDTCTGGAGECQDFTYCTGSPAKCTLWPSAGSACSAAGESDDYRECLGGDCADGTCVERGALGASCTASSECSSGNCRSGSCAANAGSCLSP